VGFRVHGALRGLPTSFEKDDDYFGVSGRWTAAEWSGVSDVMAMEEQK
jgi:hypothetical protein